MITKKIIIYSDHVKIILFNFGCAGSSLLCQLFSCCSKWGLLFVVVCRLFLQWFLLLQSTAVGHEGFSSCCVWTQQL